MSNSKQKIFVSDFDGTLTTADSMFRIICYHRGKLWLIGTLLLMSPLLVLMFMGLLSNHRTKEILLGRCFGGMTEADFSRLCQRFADDNRSIMRTSLYERLLNEKRNGNDVVVVTASPERWVSRMVPEFKVLGTKLEFADEGFTGRFMTPNCYGPEKVKRLLQEYPEIRQHRSDYHITAFGDSRGDRELLAFADEGIKVNS